MSLKHRMKRLEAALQPATGVAGIRTDEGMVRVFATGEELSQSDFEERYPGRQVIHVITINARSDEKRSFPD